MRAKQAKKKHKTHTNEGHISLKNIVIGTRISYTTTSSTTTTIQVRKILCTKMNTHWIKGKRTHSLSLLRSFACLHQWNKKKRTRRKCYETLNAWVRIWIALNFLKTSVWETQRLWCVIWWMAFDFISFDVLKRPWNAFTSLSAFIVFGFFFLSFLTVVKTFAIVLKLIVKFK